MKDDRFCSESHTEDIAKRDKDMNIFTTNNSLKDHIILFICEKIKLHSSAFKVWGIDEIPL